MSNLTTNSSLSPGRIAKSPFGGSTVASTQDDEISAGENQFLRPSSTFLGSRILRFNTTMMEQEKPKPLKQRGQIRTVIVSFIISLFFAISIPKTYSKNYKFAILSSPLGNMAMREMRKTMEKAQSEIGVRFSPAVAEFIYSRASLLEEISHRHQSAFPFSKFEDQELLDSNPKKAPRPPVFPMAVIKRKIGDENDEAKFVDAADDKCYALVLPGGGTKGAFQAGSILGLVEQYNSRNVSLRWDVVAGVSVGSFFSYSSLAFRPGQNNELDFARSMWYRWYELRQQDFTSCPSPILSTNNVMRWMTDFSMALKGERHLTHLCDIQPLSDYTKSFASSYGFETSGERTAVISATRLSGGSVTWRFDDWGGKNATQVDIGLQRMISSCSVPLAFPPQHVVMQDDSPHKEWLVDGGVLKNANVEEAIEACAARVGGDYSKVVVDVLGSGPETLGDFDAGKESVFGLAVRGALVAFESGNGPSAMYGARDRYPQVQLRHSVFPYNEPPINILEADYVRELLSWGREVGWKASFFEASANDEVHLLVDLTSD